MRIVAYATIVIMVLIYVNLALLQADPCSALSNGYYSSDMRGPVR